MSAGGEPRGLIDALAASADPAMLIVTAAAGGERSGCLVGFHSQCGIDPVRYCVWLSTANHTLRVARAASHLGVHLLGAGDRALAELFGGTTGDEVDKFARCEWSPGAGGVPLLAACRLRGALARVAVLDAGSDHVGFVLAPIDGDGDDGDGDDGDGDGDDRPAPGTITPLRLGAVTDIDAGHPA